MNGRILTYFTQVLLLAATAWSSIAFALTLVPFALSMKAHIVIR